MSRVIYKSYNISKMYNISKYYSVPGKKEIRGKKGLESYLEIPVLVRGPLACRSPRCPDLIPHTETGERPGEVKTPIKTNSPTSGMWGPWEAGCREDCGQVVYPTAIGKPSLNCRSRLENRPFPYCPILLGIYHSRAL